MQPAAADASSARDRDEQCGERDRDRDEGDAGHPEVTAALLPEPGEHRLEQREVDRVDEGLKWPSCPSDRFSRELVPQTIWLLERAKAIEDGERLLRARRGLYVITQEPFGAAQCS